jgi:hypothetical protein
LSLLIRDLRRHRDGEGGKECNTAYHSEILPQENSSGAMNLLDRANPVVS